MSSERTSRPEQHAEEEDSEALLDPSRSGSLSSLHVELQHLTQATFGLDVSTTDRFKDFAWEHRKAIAICALVAVIGIVAVTAITRSNSEEEQHELRMNQIQMLGTHNSYHYAPSVEIMSALQVIMPLWVQGLAYSHVSLPQQLAAGIRNFELDVYYDPEGGMYSQRAILSVLGLSTASNDARLDQPGFKVLHISDIDFNSSCVTFVECLQQVKKFSDEHRDHLPITIKVEGKQTERHLVPNQTKPIPYSPEALLALEKEILSVFPRSRLVTPDDVQGRPRKRSTLKWPELKNARGKIMFLLIPNDCIDEYLKIPHSPSGRILFPAYNPDGNHDKRAWTFHTLSTEEASPLAAVAITRGRFVYGRADANTWEARANNFSRGAAHLHQGTNVVQTDYPIFEAPNPFGTPYTVMFVGNVLARCNLASAPAWCFPNEGELLREGGGEGGR